MVHIKKNIPPTDFELIERFSSHSAATVHEAMGRRGALDCRIKPIEKGMKICGRAFTVQCQADDNIMLIKAASMAGKGDVIICSMGNLSKEGPFGEVLAVNCQARGIEGLVFDSAIRDSADIAKMKYPVFSTGICIYGTVKGSLGTINYPISCGGQVINPGDIILGDDDGVVVIPLEEARNVLEKADARVEKEAKVMERLRAGENLFDIYGYQKVFDALGCVEEE